MFKKKVSSSKNKNVRRPGQEINDQLDVSKKEDYINEEKVAVNSAQINNIEKEAIEVINNAVSVKSDDDDEDSNEEDSDKTAQVSTIRHPTKRLKPSSLTSTTKTSTNEIEVSVAVSSNRSILPDTRTASDRHTLDWDSNKKENEMDPANPATTKTITLPNAQMKPSLTLAPTKYAFGPVRPNSSVRAISRFDYQPDVCTDWKETGYCGYGDSCKFLHDRGDYKSGWELEKEWNEKLKKKRLKREQKERIKRGRGHSDEDIASSNSDSDKDEKKENEPTLPFACHICRAPFTPALSTIETSCGHYFHESCALNRYVKNTRCAVCNKETNGTFRQAVDLEKKIEERDKKG